MISSLAEADLHNLVDGRVDPARRADLLRRLAASQTDRALVEAWQDQTEVIRASFDEVGREPLPVALNLAPPRLRCVDNDALRPIRSAGTRRGGIAAAATALVIMVGLAVSWLAIGQGDRDGGSADASAAPADAALADRATSALAGPALAATAAPLPTLRLPDLTGAGLRLTDVSTLAGDPTTMVLRYRDEGRVRVAISIARSGVEAGSAAPTALGKALTWRRAGAAFAIAGTLPPERLQAIAASLQDDPGSE